MTTSHAGRVLLVLILVLLTGCGLPTLPSQGSPTCSWASQVPKNPDRICTRTVRTLQILARAVAHNDQRTVHSLVVDPQTADKMIAYSQKVRAEHIRDLHVVPSVELDVESHGTIGAGFFLLGLLPHGKINSPQTLYFRWIGGKYLVTASDLDKDW